MQKLLTLLLFSAFLAACQTTKPQPQAALTPLPTTSVRATSEPEATASTQSAITKDSLMNATVTTSKGAFVITLDPSSAPKTVDNFVSKAKSDFYKNLTFHRVEDWVVQGGDPDGNGTGGGSMPTELSQTPFVRGSVGVARGMDIKISNDSQFFICTKDCDWLTGAYTLFGQVTEGMEVVDAMSIGDTIKSIAIE